jgi:hypothetical protein
MFGLQIAPNTSKSLKKSFLPGDGHDHPLICPLYCVPFRAQSSYNEALQTLRSKLQIEAGRMRELQERHALESKEHAAELCEAERKLVEAQEVSESTESLVTVMKNSLMIVCNIHANSSLHRLALQ